MEDVIAVEEPVVNNSRAYLLENQDKMVSEISVEANAAMKTLTNVPSERDYCGPSNLNLLVLEVWLSVYGFSRKGFLIFDKVFTIFSLKHCCRFLRSIELLIHHMVSPLIRCLLDVRQD